jgi:NADPH:quinone reductase-like Zn-dependent oxidoreductase
MASVHSAQKVQSYEQMRASLPCSNRAHRSQELFIDESLYAFHPKTPWRRTQGMQAIVVEHLGGAGSCKDIPVPKPGEYEILVRVITAGVNPLDWKRRDRPTEKFPFVMGQDFAGVVSQTGARVTKYREGERIFGIAGEHGSYAQYTIVSEDDREQPIAKIPDNVGDADAAALPTAGLTALASVEALQPASGSNVLVLGATGGVGSLAVQIARDRGAQVIGTGGAASEEFARSLGVNEFIAYDRSDVVEAVKNAHPEGVDAVLDLVNDADAIKNVATAMHAESRIVSTIGSADVDWFAQRKIVAQNLRVFEAPQFSHAGLRTLLEMLEHERIRVVIAGERPLSEALAAVEASRGGRVNGKLVITVE